VPTSHDESEARDRTGAPVVHFEINGKHLKALSASYSQLFGWQVHEAMPTWSLVHTEAGGKGIQEGISKLQGLGQPHQVERFPILANGGPP
jgi:predicted enzyme related to lactoylglutathione lyase